MNSGALQDSGSNIKPPRKLHEFGKDPFRHVMGILYALQAFLIGLCLNPLTPISTYIRYVNLVRFKVALQC